MRQEGVTQGSVDIVSSLAREATELGGASAYTRLVTSGPGTDGVREAVEKLAGSEALATVKDRNMAQCLVAGMWLWHDWLEEAHRLVQPIPTETGNFWHAVMHRREGDFDNSRYWYARCADHPAMAILAAQSGDIINAHPADKTLLRLAWNGWNPAVMVDLVQQVHQKPEDPRYVIAVRLQQLEWRVLSGHCLRGIR